MEVFQGIDYDFNSITVYIVSSLIFFLMQMHKYPQFSSEVHLLYDIV